MKHAWVSPDGTHAMEVTLRYSPMSIEFFGIAFPAYIVTRAVMERDGMLPLLDAAYGPDPMGASVASARADRDYQFGPKRHIASAENG